MIFWTQIVIASFLGGFASAAYQSVLNARRARAREREFRNMLLEEYGYWRNQDTDEGEAVELVRMGAMGSVSNVLGRLITGVAAERAPVEQQKGGQSK